jgi:hypothetical protein
MQVGRPVESSATDVARLLRRPPLGAGPRPAREEFALTDVLGHRRGASKFGSGFVKPSDLGEEVTAHAR